MESSHIKIQAKWNPSKSLQNFMKPRQKSKTTDRHSGIDKVVRFLEDDGWRWQVMKNGDDIRFPWALFQ